MMTIKHKKIEILITDDDQGIRGLLELIFRKEGHEVFSCASGPECIEAAKSQWAEVIFLDVNMPGMGGVETLEALKADPKTKDIPVIMLTAVGEANIVKKSMVLGAVEFLVKPINKVLIKERLSYFTAYLDYEGIREMLLKSSVSDYSSFKGPGVSDYIIEEFDCYPLVIDKFHCSVLVRKNITPANLRKMEDAHLDENCLVYIKSTLSWFPLWPNRKLAVNMDDNLDDMIEMELS